jgi:hypothetical protein
MKTTPQEIKRRKASLKASGHTYDDLARLSGVSWRMVKFWLDGQRTSAKVAGAFATLTARTRKNGDAAA